MFGFHSKCGDEPLKFPARGSGAKRAVGPDVLDNVQRGRQRVVVMGHRAGGG